MHEDNTPKSYVLVVQIDVHDPRVHRGSAYGPFPSRADAEHAAMDYYGTAITGASVRGAFLISELRAEVPKGGAWK